MPTSNESYSNSASLSDIATGIGGAEVMAGIKVAVAAAVSPNSNHAVTAVATEDDSADNLDV